MKEKMEKSGYSQDLRGRYLVRCRLLNELFARNLEYSPGVSLQNEILLSIGQQSE